MFGFLSSLASSPPPPCSCACSFCCCSCSSCSSCSSDVLNYIGPCVPFQSAGAEDSVWITGAAPLPASLQWEKFKVASAVPGTLDAEQSANNQHGCRQNVTFGGCTCHANVAAPSQCQAMCQTLGPNQCKSYGWSGRHERGWQNQCCIRSDDVWSPVTQTDHVSGK